MVESVSGLHQHIALATGRLLDQEEIVAIVDDDPSIREPLKLYLEKQGLAVEESDSAAALFHLLSTRNVALILLDIGLPDVDGISVLPQIVNSYPDAAIIMLTGVADLQVAMDCIRKGADDYLSKPVRFNEILFVVKKTLEKRRLLFENRKYHQELEEAHFRIQLLHQLSIKMNTVYLSTTELDEILQAILVGITANEGLQFNRAFLAMFDDAQQVLEGRMAIGPDCREEAARLWAEMREMDLNFLDIVHNLRQGCVYKDVEVNRIVRELRVPLTDMEHILIKAAVERRSIRVVAGNGDDKVSPELLELLGEDTFVVVPLYSPRRSFGVIIADNFVTRRPITDSHVKALELFASQASLAIEQSQLYTDMQHKIAELQALNREIDKNKDQLVQAERYAALGHMSAQLVHSIRNPVTSIGGVSRLLAKKITNEEWAKYLNVITKETGRIDAILEDLSEFVVAQHEPSREAVSLYTVIRKTVMLNRNSLDKNDISLELDLPEPEPVLRLDLRQTQQMLLHLLRNAIEAMPNGGAVTIAVNIDDRGAHITVRDTGSGIVETHIEKAQDPFFTTKTYRTGLGLTMVERVAKAHGGNFELKTLDQGGTEAVVHLPPA